MAPRIRLDGEGNTPQQRFLWRRKQAGGCMRMAKGCTIIPREGLTTCDNCWLDIKTRMANRRAKKEGVS